MNSVFSAETDAKEFFDGDSVKLHPLFKFNQYMGTELYKLQGVFRPDLLAKGCVIVYTDIYLKIFCRDFGEKLTACTAFSGRKGIRTSRMMFISNDSGKPVIQMLTNSVYMNFYTRRVSKPLNELSFVPAEGFEKPSFLRMPEDAAFLKNITVTDFYTDENNHTNNASYAAFIDSMLTDDERSKLDCFGIKYVKESLLGDTLHISEKKDGKITRFWGNTKENDCFEAFAVITDN